MARITQAILAAFALFHLVSANYTTQKDASIFSNNDQLEKSNASCHMRSSHAKTQRGTVSITNKSRSLALLKILTSVLVISLIGFLVTQCVRSLKQNTSVRSRRLAKSNYCAGYSEYEMVPRDEREIPEELQAPYQSLTEAVLESQPVQKPVLSKKKKILMAVAAAVVAVVVLGIVISINVGAHQAPNGISVDGVGSTTAQGAVQGMGSTTAQGAVQDMGSTTAQGSVTDAVQDMGSTTAQGAVQGMGSTTAQGSVTDAVQDMGSTTAQGNVINAVEEMGSGEVTDSVHQMEGDVEKHYVEARGHGVGKRSVDYLGSRTERSPVADLNWIIRNIWSKQNRVDAVINYLRSGASEPIFEAANQIAMGYQGKTGKNARQLNKNEAVLILQGLKTLHVMSEHMFELVNQAKTFDLAENPDFF